MVPIRKGFLSVLVLALLFVFVVGACQTKAPAQVAKQPVPAGNPVADEQAQQAAKVEDFRQQTQQAIATLDTGGCASITDDQFRANCVDNVLYQKALKSQDLTQCDKVVGASLKSSCTDTITLQKAISSKDKTMCSRITDQNAQALCLNAIAAATK